MTSPSAQHDAPPSSARRRVPLWKKALLAASICLMLLGLAVQAYTYLQQPDNPATPVQTSQNQPPPTSSDPGPDPGRSFLPTDPNLPDPSPTTQPDPPAPASDPAPATGADTTARDWSPLAFKFGFSFFVGFCIGYAIRMFFKISLLAIGLVLLALFGLQYLGLIHIDWPSLQPHYDSALQWLQSQTAGFRRFITGQLPATALVALGLFLGFRK